MARGRRRLGTKPARKPLVIIVCFGTRDSKSHPVGPPRPLKSRSRWKHRARPTILAPAIAIWVYLQRLRSKSSYPTVDGERKQVSEVVTVLAPPTQRTYETLSSLRVTAPINCNFLIITSTSTSAIPFGKREAMLSIAAHPALRTRSADLSIQKFKVRFGNERYSVSR